MRFPNGIPCVTGEQMAAIDRRAASEFGVPDSVPMENAGRQVARFLCLRLGDPDGGEILILCGHGNNGGDGLVAARYLANAGHPVRVVMPPPAGHVKPLAAVNLRILKAMGLAPEVAEFTPELLGKRGHRPRAVVEALYGTGGRGGIMEGTALLFAEIERLGIPGLAVDNPAGLDPATGKAAERVFPAKWTVTLALPKVGQVVNRGACGELVVADIGLPSALIDDPAVNCRLVTPHLASRWLGPRDPMAHKGTRGHLAVVAGSTGKTGAAYLAALGGLRSGAGLVTLACPAGIHASVEKKAIEVMTLPLPDAEGAFAPRSLPPFQEVMDKFKSLAVGPGIGTDGETADFLVELLEEFPRPAVVDADGLNLLAMHGKVLDDRKAPTVLTPHPGEASRLLKIPTGEVLDDPVGAARSLASRFGAVAVLKMATTAVAAPDGEVWLNPTGNPGMATAGMGDVLTGVIGALLARGMHDRVAAAAGMFVHGLAGDLAAAEVGETALTASDLLARLGEAFEHPELGRAPAYLE